MKNLFTQIVKQVKSQVSRLEGFAFALTLPLVFSNTLPISLPTVNLTDTQEETEKTSVEQISKAKLDFKNPNVFALDEKNLEIKRTESYFDIEQRLASEALKNLEARRLTRLDKRDVFAREKPRVALNPDLEQKRALVKAAAARYGIPWQVLEAVWQVESGKSWDTLRRSYAGAVGPMQFLPSTFRKYGVDANGDGKADIASAYDSVYAGANLLSCAGGSSGQVERALFAYNHSDSYVQKVLRIAREIGY